MAFRQMHHNPQVGSTYIVPITFCQATGIREAVRSRGFIYEYIGDNDKGEQCYVFDRKKNYQETGIMLRKGN